MKTLSIAILSALLASPALASAQEAPFQSREAVTVKVSTNGLDLSSPRDQQRLRGRMNRAIEAMCSPSDVYAAYSERDNQCYHEMAQSASAQLQAYAQNTETGTVAKN